MMTCQELIGFLTDYLDGQLPLTQRMAFDLHLTLCRDCRSYLHNFKTTITAAKDSSADIPAIPEELVEAILKSRKVHP